MLKCFCSVSALNCGLEDAVGVSVGEGCVWGVSVRVNKSQTQSLPKVSQGIEFPFLWLPRCDISLRQSLLSLK